MGSTMGKVKGKANEVAGEARQEVWPPARRTTAWPQLCKQLGLKVTPTGSCL